MMQLQIEEILPLLVIPVRPRERVVQMLREQGEAPTKRVRPVVPPP